MPRQDTKLEAEGAEFLVLSQLLIQHIPAYKAYTNMPGYDIIAHNPKTNWSAKIQVKSRWRTGAPFFLVKNFDCDFLVAVRLNRGRKGGGVTPSAPDFFVLPVTAACELVRDRGTTWSKIVFRDIDEKYTDKWSLIAEFLAG